MKQASIIGNIGFDAVIKEYNGNKYVQFSVAVNEKYKKTDGTTVETTDWINCQYRNIALAQYLTKGTKVFVQGKWSVNVYKGKDGQHRAGVDISAHTIELLSSKKEDNNATGDRPAPPVMAPETDAPPADDLPF